MSVCPERVTATTGSTERSHDHATACKWLAVVVKTDANFVPILYPSALISYDRACSDMA